MFYDPGAFSAVFIAFYVAHGVADHWIQTDYQAATRGKPGTEGRLACAVAILFGLGVTVWGLLAGQVVSAATHYWADRRFTLARLCDRLGRGRLYRFGAPRTALAWTEPNHGEAGGPYDVNLYQVGVEGPVPWDNPSLGTGAYVLDQWWHIGWLFVAAIVTVTV